MRQWQAHEKKRPKEDRELINKHKPFAKLQTAEDFEKFVNGVMRAFVLLYLKITHFELYLPEENSLRARIKELQDYRQNGITSIGDAEKFVRDSATRVSPALLLHEYSESYGRSLLLLAVHSAEWHIRKSSSTRWRPIFTPAGGCELRFVTVDRRVLSFI